MIVIVKNDRGWEEQRERLIQEMLMNKKLLKDLEDACADIHIGHSRHIRRSYLLISARLYVHLFFVYPVYKRMSYIE